MLLILQEGTSYTLKCPEFVIQTEIWYGLTEISDTRIRWWIRCSVHCSIKFSLTWHSNSLICICCVNKIVVSNNCVNIGIWNYHEYISYIRVEAHIDPCSLFSRNVDRNVFLFFCFVCILLDCLFCGWDFYLDASLNSWVV